MKIIITGGHLTPAMAVIEKLNVEDKILFVGRKHSFENEQALSFEYQTIRKMGIPFYSLITGRLQRKWTRHTLFSLLKFPVGLSQSLWWVFKFKPEIILSFGGYVSLPVVLAGFILRVPIIIHEQTLGAGLANKIASFFASKILISWEDSKKIFPQEKTVLTGNPVRREILNKIHNSEFKIYNSDKNLPLLYVTGGSLGSHVINLTIEKIIKKLLEDFIVIHQTGDSKKYQDFERLRKLKNRLNPKLKKRYFLKKHILSSHVGWVLNRADLVIGRAGANTVTELLYLEKKAILIPLPFSQGDEQAKNASLLKKAKLGEVIMQGELTSGRLYKRIKYMMSKKIKKVIRFDKADAAEKIMEVVLNEISKTKE